MASHIALLLFADIPVQPEHLPAAALRQALPGRAQRELQAAAESAVLGQHDPLRLQGQDEGRIHAPHVALHAGRFYRVTHLLADLGWVDFDLGSSPGLLGQ